MLFCTRLAQLNFHKSIAHQDLFASRRFTDSCRNVDDPVRAFSLLQRKSEAHTEEGWKIQHLLYIRHSKLDQIQDDLGKRLGWIQPTLPRITLRLCVVSFLPSFYFTDSFDAHGKVFFSKHDIIYAYAYVIDIYHAINARFSKGILVKRRDLFNSSIRMIVVAKTLIRS